MGAGCYMFWPLQLHRLERLRHSVLLPFNHLSLMLLGDRKTSHITMATSTPSSIPPFSSGSSSSGSGGSGGGPLLPVVSVACMKIATSANFTMPPGTSLKMLTGKNWNTWSSPLSMILQLNNVDCITSYNHCPSGVDKED